ncbi:type I restriction enzyme [Streptococcus pneumoniae]|nr:type I restriction enzyme [Streptococcus pneumoniae]
MTPEQLKASILQRAMEGKLVPQNPNDEPASELLKRIKAEKEKLISEGKIKRDKKETEIFRGDDGKHYGKFADGSTQEIDVPYDIPDTWEWVRIKSIYWNFGQNKPEKSFRYIDTSSIDRKKNIINYKNLQYLSPEQAPSRARKLVSQNSVLFSTVRPYLKNIAVVRELKEYLIASTAFIVLDTLLNETYLKYYLLSDNFINRVNNKSTGTSYPAINDYNFNLLLIALPPLSEQQRIVEAIESALEKVDEYAESYNRLEQLDKEFPDKLKKSILQYAMQGKLVEQDPNDESVEVLLEKIRAEKQKLFEEGKIKKKDLDISIVSQGDDNLYIPKKLRNSCLSWLESENRRSGYLFLNKFNEPITARGVAQQLKNYADKYKMNPKVIYPHSFRHLFAKNFLAKYNDIALLADLMGHESIETTRIYLRKTATEQQNIVDKIVNW